MCVDFSPLPGNDCNEPQLVVHVTEQQSILHDDPTTGHYEIQRSRYRTRCSPVLLGRYEENDQ